MTNATPNPLHSLPIALLAVLGLALVIAVVACQPQSDAEPKPEATTEASTADTPATGFTQSSYKLVAAEPSTEQQWAANLTAHLGNMSMLAGSQLDDCDVAAQDVGDYLSLLDTDLGVANSMELGDDARHALRDAYVDLSKVITRCLSSEKGRAVGQQLSQSIKPLVQN